MNLVDANVVLRYLVQAVDEAFKSFLGLLAAKKGGNSVNKVSIPPVFT